MAKLNSTEQKLLQDIEEWKETGPGFLNTATHVATKPLLWAAEKLIPSDIQDRLSGVGEKIAEKLQDASQWTVREDEVLKATKEFEIDGKSILELQNASVFDLNHVAEEFVKFNTRLAAAEGFGTGLLGWAGLIADLPALFVLNFRMLYQISLSFGYKVEVASEEGDEPFEVGYMLRIFKIATAASSEAKEVALQELKEYEDSHPDGIARVGSDFTRNQLGKGAAINISRIIINQIVKETLARKAITSIPGIGALLTAGFNYYYVHDVGRTAIMIYQERFLLDKKGRKKVVTIDVE
jgi:hypothetical protein